MPLRRDIPADVVNTSEYYIMKYFIKKKNIVLQISYIINVTDRFMKMKKEY
jgi:hypothetical protein